MPGKEMERVMMTKIAIVAGDIWAALDRDEGSFSENLLELLESRERSRDLLLMALGWLVYEKHVKWVPEKNGGRLFLVGSSGEEGHSREKSDQNDFAVNNA